MTHLIRMVESGGAFFLQFVQGFLPALLILMTATYTLRSILNPDRLDRWVTVLGQNILTRYSVLPFLASFFETNPEAYSVGEDLPERYKPAFYDSTVSFIHPALGLLPHVNPAEIFMWAGIAFGVHRLDLPYGPLALRYLLVGLVVIWIRGVVTQLLTQWFAQRDDLQLSEIEHTS